MRGAVGRNPDRSGANLSACEEHQARYRRGLFGSDRGFFECEEFQSAGRDRFSQILFAMGETQRRQQRDAVALMRFDGEGENSRRREDARDHSDDFVEVVHIDKNVGGKNDVVFRAVRDLVGEDVRQIADYQTIVEVLGLRARDHRWREVDADQMRRKGPKGRSNKPSAAAEIEQRLKSHRPSETAQDGIHRVAKDCRAAIMQLLGQGRVVARR